LIPQEIIQEVIDTAKIEEVVGEVIQLKRRGTNLIGLCPFHNEKTPSFTVSPSKNIFKCFGCGNGGGAVQFIMENQSIGFLEAIKYLANKYKIELPEIKLSPEDLIAGQKNESFYILNSFAADYYSNQLLNTNRGKSIALSYFKQRGFLDSTIEKFGLGWADIRERELLDAARKMGYEENLLEEVGLTKNKKDFFRNRVIFPIQNSSGKIIAFAGRTLVSTSKAPKYLNSPETAIFNKRKSLYGIYHAKSAIRKMDNCYLVEGYTDVIALYQAGIENVVASSGTSLTEEQIGLIKRHTENITVLFDGDQAGLTAAIRGVDLILAQDLNVKIVVLPEGEDPDSTLKNLGASDFKKYLHEESIDFILFKSKYMMNQIGSDPIKKVQLINDIVQSISKIPNPLKRSVYIKECQGLLDVEESLLVIELNKLLQKGRLKSNKKSLSSDLKIANIETPKTLSDAFQEKDLIRIIISAGSNLFSEDPVITVADYILENIEDVLDGFENPLYKEIIMEVISHSENGKIPNSGFFINHNREEFREIASDVLSTPYEYSPNWEKRWDVFLQSQKMPDLNFIKDTENMLLRFKLKKIGKAITDNSIKIKTLFEKQDENYILHLKIDRELKNLRNEIASMLGTVVL
jgi:DNA primase